MPDNEWYIHTKNTAALSPASDTVEMAPAHHVSANKKDALSHPAPVVGSASRNSARLRPPPPSSMSAMETSLDRESLDRELPTPARRTPVLGLLAKASSSLPRTTSSGLIAS